MSCRGYIHHQDHFDGLIFGRVLLGARSLMHELALPPNYGGLVESKHEKFCKISYVKLSISLFFLKISFSFFLARSTPLW